MKCLKKFMKRVVGIMIYLRLVPLGREIDETDEVTSSSSDTSLY